MEPFRELLFASAIARRWSSTSRAVRRALGGGTVRTVRALRSASSSRRCALSRVFGQRDAASARGAVAASAPPALRLVRSISGRASCRGPDGKRALVDGELLDRGLFERAAEAGERVAVVEVVEVAFVLARRAGDVEAGLGAGARERDVAPFLQARFAGAEDEGALDGEALGGVAGERVGVADVAGLEVAGG